MSVCFIEKIAISTAAVAFELDATLLFRQRNLSGHKNKSAHTHIHLLTCDNVLANVTLQFFEFRASA